MEMEKQEWIAGNSEKIVGSLTLCLPLDFHNPLQHSPLRLIFLSNFCFFSLYSFVLLWYNRYIFIFLIGASCIIKNIENPKKEG